jgi:hypothetical protein
MQNSFATIKQNYSFQTKLLFSLNLIPGAIKGTVRSAREKRKKIEPVLW